METYYYLVESEGETLQLKLPDKLVQQFKAENLLPLQSKQPEFYHVSAS
jgi:hypothetical protein